MKFHGSLFTCHPTKDVCIVVICTLYLQSMESYAGTKEGFCFFLLQQMNMASSLDLLKNLSPIHLDFPPVRAELHVISGRIQVKARIGRLVTV